MRYSDMYHELTVRITDLIMPNGYSYNSHGTNSQVNRIVVL
jgi:hypothetical protein